ncbi:MAG: leucine-rich repeat protein [Bacteroides sp.]|nr:leucine-rich repeat protein [Bacteroides sp.]
MKRTLQTWCILLLIKWFGSVPAHAVMYNGFDYHLSDDGTAMIDGGWNTSGDVVIPPEIMVDGVRYTVSGISERAFRLSSITSVIMPNTINNIGYEAFADCHSLSSITMPDALVIIGDYAFECCENLTEIAIPDGVTSIGNGAFSRCCGLSSIQIPATVTQVGNGAFSGCNHLSDIIVHADNSHYCSVDGILFNKELNQIIQFPAGKNTQLYEIPNGVSIIRGSAFSGAELLESIVIPNSTDSIGTSVFSNCYNLTSITLHAQTPPKSSWYFNLYNTVTLYVPYESIDAYKSADSWKKFVNIVGYKTTETIKINELAFVISHTNNTATVTYAEQNSLGNYEGMQSVIVPETVEYEGESYKVVGIGDEAFNNCWGLKAVSLPSTLQSIGKLAFGYCTSLRSVTIPEEVTIVDNEAFTGCSALASVTIGGSVETIGDYAFFGCTGLASLHVPESVKAIGENAFMGIHWINEVHAKASEPAEAPVSAFSTNAYRNATLVVPDGAVDTYKAHPTWSNFLEIHQNSDIPTNIQVVDGAIVVKGAESVRVYNMSGAQVYSGATGRIELPAGIYLVTTDSISKKVKI